MVDYRDTQGQDYAKRCPVDGGEWIVMCYQFLKAH